jgi:hypothetical protein
MNKHLLGPFLIGIVIGGSMMVILGGLAWFAGPAIESKFFPIIRFDFVAGSAERKDHELCWELHNHKYRDGVPARFDYRAIYQGHTYALNVDRIDESGHRIPLTQYGFANHLSGQEWTVTYCAELPSKIPPNSYFSMEGEGFYDTGHPWRVPVILPGFEVTPKF